MKSIGILWNSMNDYVDEAITDLSKNMIIEKIIDINLSDDLENFIWEIYGNYPPIVYERVKTKIEYTVNSYDSRNITILIMGETETSKQDLKKIKMDIRSKYSNKVEKYNYDNVFHMTEDEMEYDRVICALKKYTDLDFMNNEESNKKLLLT